MSVRTLRRAFPIIALVVAIVAILFIRWEAERRSRPPLNFSQIDEGLWLGGRVSEPPPGTQTVINLCETEDSYRAESHRWVPIPDAAPAPSLNWLREQVEFVESARAANRVVYIHCFAGISRGGMVTTAYLMKREKWTRDQALEYIRSRRPGVRPNPAFMELLLEWERTLKG
jgi:hypothetical protein